MNNQNQTQEMSLVLKEEEEEEVEQLVKSLPKASIMNNQYQLINYRDVWYPNNSPYFLKGVLILLKCQKHFEPRDTDIIITSHPKTGTTWLKSLVYAIVNRVEHPISQTPLLNHNPHELIYRLENDIYGGATKNISPNYLDEMPSPRLLQTHLSYNALPNSIKADSSKCRIVHISRNPLDTFVSQWHFITKSMKQKNENYKTTSMEDDFDDFCNGLSPRGPYFEHVVEYWKQSLEDPNKVLFLKYEDLKVDPKTHVKRLAEFIGSPFSEHEESEGVIDDIVEFCSIDNLKGLEVNKSGAINRIFEKKSFFRKGDIGDWRNYFTQEMVNKMNELMEQKFACHGLYFQVDP